MTFATTAGTITLGGAVITMEALHWTYPEPTIIARFEDPETGQAMVTIQTEAGEIFTRPSTLMHIYRMGYGDRWRRAWRSLSPAPTGRV